MFSLIYCNDPSVLNLIVAWGSAAGNRTKATSDTEALQSISDGLIPCDTFHCYHKKEEE